MRLITVLSFLIFLQFGSAEIPSPDDAPLPLSPEESKKHFKLTDGFRIDLIASEPLIRDPSCIAWDSKGRLFVTEIHGYNLEGHLDVTELNKTGKLDTSIRRIRVGPKLKAEAQKGQTGSLKLLRDLDGDGKMDESILWADDIPAAYGVISLDEGIIITAAPHIIFFADTDGDNRPDVRKTLFTGFTVGEMERAINNPVMGPDGWIYAGQGWGGGDITGPNLKGIVKMGRTDFRFKADGSAIEPASGSNHTFGMAFDDVGNRFLITTSRPALYAVPLPYHYLKRNPHVGTPNLTATASDYHNTFPMSAPHPWRQKRGADPRWVKFYGAGEAEPNGNFTSACGQQIYRAKLFPESFHGNYFCCDPQQSMVHRAQVGRAGSGLVVKRHSDHSDSEFLTSTDGWFRPNNLRVGPDGALYVIDMYREIIEDYSAIPRYMQQQYGLLNGNDRGRIWRVAPGESKPFPIKTNRYEPASLVSDQIRSLYGSGSKLLEAMRDSHYGVRVHALRVADQKFKTNPELLNAALDLIKNESDPNVLLQLALSLGESDDPRSVAGLVQLATHHSDVRWMNNAVLSSIGNKAGPFFELAIKKQSKIGTSILEQVAQTAARSGAAKSLLAAIDHPDPALRLRILSLAAKNGIDVSDSLRSIANESISDSDSSEEQRIAALQLISYASPDVVKSGVRKFLSPTQNPDFQAQAIRVTLAQANKVVAEQLIEYLPRSTPRIATLITEALLTHPETIKQLLSSNTKVQFSALQMYRLRNHEESEIRKLTQSLSFRSNNELKEKDSHKNYYAALNKDPDLERGSALFMVHCANCHQFGGQGIAVGPPLDGESGRPAESLLADVLNPSSQITAGYSTYIGKLKGGISHTGVLSSESATSLTLLQAAGAKTQILRSDLLSLSPIELSLMPPTFSEIMKPEELADVIGYLRNHKRSGSLVLFDDDPGFPGVLSAGKGNASLEWKNCASGRACLTVSGFQRYSAQLPGWSFSVKEDPQGKDQFRYLRLAMKSIDANGMMIELADNGKFPPNDKPVRTYYIGKNTTGWKSNQLDKEVPNDWKVYTIDLWKNNGDFIITGMAFTTMGGKGNYDRIELLRNDPRELN